MDYVLGKRLFLSMKHEKGFRSKWGESCNCRATPFGDNYIESKKERFFFFRCLMFILLDERQVKVSSLKLGGENVLSIFLNLRRTRYSIINFLILSDYI